MAIWERIRNISLTGLHANDSPEGPLSNFENVKDENRSCDKCGFAFHLYTHSNGPNPFDSHTMVMARIYKIKM